MSTPISNQTVPHGQRFPRSKRDLRTWDPTNDPSVPERAALPQSIAIEGYGKVKGSVKGLELLSLCGKHIDVPSERVTVPSRIKYRKCGER